METVLNLYMAAKQETVYSTILYLRLIILSASSPYELNVLMLNKNIASRVVTSLVKLCAARL